MEFTDVLVNRRSIRSFSEKPIDESTLNEILSSAIESPSSSNTQPYKMAVATGGLNKAIGKDLLDKYYAASKINTMPLPLKAVSAITSGALPDGDFKPILGKYPDEFQKRRVITGQGLYEILGIERHDKKSRDEQMAKNFTFFNAPVAIFFFIHPGMKYTALIDLGIFMQSLMLIATDKGLGTCAQGALGICNCWYRSIFTITDCYLFGTITDGVRTVRVR